MSEGLKIDWIGGNCPVQAEGTIDGKEFYFRSRGDSWSMGIGGDDVILNPEWEYEEAYGTWPDAGWITEEQARAFIDKAVGLYRAALSTRPSGEPESVLADLRSGEDATEGNSNEPRCDCGHLFEICDAPSCRTEGNIKST